MSVSRNISRMLACLLCGFAAISVGAASPTAPLIETLDAPAAGRFVALALSCVHQEYPNKLSHSMASDADALPPRQLTPAFYGCYDWHSSVHGHWLLVRALRRFPGAPFAAAARAALQRSLSDENLRAELRYLQGPGRAAFERPYGLAWLLQLDAELHEWQDPQARVWSQNLEPLARAAASRIGDWLPKLRYPVRSGEHSQSAFALGLMHDWARIRGDGTLRALIESKARPFYGSDRRCPLGYEPSGEDFLSPCLAEADFMRRVLAPADYARWLRAFLPGIPSSGAHWLEPGIVTDRGDPKLAHIDGLNLSRAWMLAGIASGLLPGDRRAVALRAASRRHAAAALPAVSGEHYEGGHWLGSFALYLTTGSEI